MAYPPGISLAVIQAGKAGTFFGDAASLTATVTPVLSGTKYLVHQATGDLMVPSAQTFTASSDSVLSFSVPHVDQAGYLDDNAQAYTMWAYQITVTVLIGNGRQVKKHTWTKNFQPLVGQDFIDIDTIASGVISEAVSAPVAYVTDIEGQTGSVDIEPIVDAGVTRAINEGRINPTPDDSELAALINDAESLTGVAVSGIVSPLVEPLVPPLVADALASDNTVADAAAAAVGDAVQGLDLVETVQAPPTVDAEGGTLDNDGRMTWLTHDTTGGPTAYARERIGVVEATAEVAGGFVDSDRRQTDLVFGVDGHVPDRVINLWADRIKAAQGLTTTGTRVFWGHSMAWGKTGGSTSIDTYLAPLLGRTVVNKGVGGQLSSEIMARVLADTQYRAAVVYIWPARNDLNKAGTSPEQAVRNIRRMLEHLTPVRRKVLIFEEPPWTGDTYGSTTRTQPNGLDSYNNAIKAAFPEYWVPLASWMLTDEAAASVGLTFTATDDTQRAQGVTPASFRVDDLHYNSLGNQAAAHRIRQEEQARGWV